METTRFFKARAMGYVCAVAMALTASPLFAQTGAQESTATLISFYESESLRSTDALGILSERLHLRAGTDELRPVYNEHPGGGLEMQRFQQYFKGLKVAHGSYTLTSKNGVAAYAFGKYFDITPETAIMPVLTDADALDNAMKATGASKYVWQVSGTAAPKGELQFVEDFTYGQPDGKARLAYAFDIYAAEPLSREMIYVDAQSGKILLRDAILKHVAASGASLYSGAVNFEAQLSGSNYILADATRGNGVFTYNLNNTAPNGGGGNGTYSNITSTTTTFPSSAAIDAHWGAEKVYDYWKTKRNRSSWNGKDSSLKSYVHYGTNYINAFWDGVGMNYGDGGNGYGAFTALDVCGHEIGHGVCQSTAALVYSGESGGMNEGFSDIWGAVIEAYADPKEMDAVAKNTWLIGEELGVTLRDMSNPPAFNQPNTYLGRYWIFTGSGCDNSNDKCGVHTNSGVLNYWFYLLTAGGKGTNGIGNSFGVNGIGIDKAAAIAYATELTLTQTSNYAACRTASIAAATTLYGACSKEVEAVTRAWYAVNVGAAFSACTPQISFAASTASVTENAGINACSPSQTFSLPIVLNGPAVTGGNAVVTIAAIGGTAVAGVDYALPATTTVTFSAGSAASQTFPVTIYDNPYVGVNKYVDLALSVNAAGSNATVAAPLDTIRLTIINDDRSPLAGGTETHTVGSSGSTAIKSSPFASQNANARAQFIYSAAELSASSLRVGVPITAIQFNVTGKGSKQAFTGYTVKIGTSGDVNFTSGFVGNNLTTVYSSNFTTAKGLNMLTFTTPYIWDGVSNLVVETCFGNTSAGTANDTVAASASGSAAAITTSTSSSGCSLTTLAGSNISYYRPVIRFIQEVSPTPVDTNVNDARSWNIKSTQTGFFYSIPNNEVIAAVMQPSGDLGCVSSKITAQGKGFVPTTGGLLRSVREITISSATALPAGTTYDATIYFRNSDLDNQDPAVLSLVQTSAANDAGMTAANTVTTAPAAITITNGLDWTGFRTTFASYGRFFLINGYVAAGVNNTIAGVNELWTGANPFTISPVLHWNLSKSEQVSIRLTDVTGKTVFNTERSLEAGVHQTGLSVDAGIAPGTYILQVVRPGSVFTRQLLKQ